MEHFFSLNNFNLPQKLYHVLKINSVNGSICIRADGRNDIYNKITINKYNFFAYG